MNTLLLALVAAAGLATGTPAPDVSAKNQDGHVVRISELKGKPVLIYFYPKDDTPGCTKEACELRDTYKRFEKAGAVVLGVSRQDAESHKAFKAKYHLPFDLLSDPDGKFADAFRAEHMAVVGLNKRQSVLLDKDGKVVKFFEDVDPEKHAAEVLGLLEKQKEERPAGSAPAR